MSLLKPFNIMAKPVCGTCNLDCVYCYYTSKPQELYPNAGELRMSQAVLASYVRQYIEAMPVEAQFGWQGGEPLLRGIDFYRRAVALQKDCARDGQTIGNAIQTNGTLLDEEWADFFAEHDFLVGVSLDGPAQWHDRFRRDRSGGGTFHRGWAGLELLRARGVEFNVLVTLNSANAPHAGDIYRYFVNRGVRYVQFIPILERTPDGTVAEYCCTAEQLGRFMLEVFDQWASRDVGRVSVRLIDSVMHTLMYGEASSCCQARRCANSHVLEYNGDLYVCDHFVYRQWRIGNIIETPLAELVTSDMLEEFSALKTSLPAACRGCEFLRFCNGGCPKHHMPIGTDPDRTNYFCVGYREFFRRALPRLERICEQVHDGRLEAPQPAAGPAVATSGGASPGKRPGRNDPCPCGSGRKFKNCCGRG